MAEGGASYQQNKGIQFSFSRYFRFPNSVWSDGFVHEKTIHSNLFPTGSGITMQLQMIVKGTNQWGTFTFVLEGKLDSPEKVELSDLSMNIAGYKTTCRMSSPITSTTDFQTVCEHISNYQNDHVYTYNPCAEVSFPNTFYLSSGELTVNVEGKISFICDKTDNTEESNNSIQVPVLEIDINPPVPGNVNTVEGVCLSGLLENPQYSDIDISVNGKNFSVHKAILCFRSKGFAEMIHDLESKNGNNPVNIITVDDFNADVVKEGLSFMYTGTCSKIKDIATKLLHFADKFKMNDLKMSCETEIKSAVNIATVCSLFDLADKYNANSLKSVCIEFLQNNSTEIMDTESWNELKQSNPNAVISLLESILRGSKK